MSDISICTVALKDSNMCMNVFGPATLEIRGIHYICCDKPQHYGATGDTSGISVTVRKM